MIATIIVIIIIVIIGILLVTRYQSTRPSVKTIKNADGSVIIIASNGIKTTVNPNGITIVENPDGTKTVTNKNTNKEKTTNKDGSTTTKDKKTGKTTTEPHDGFQKTVDGIGKALGPLVTNPMFYAGVGANIALSSALPALFDKGVKKSFGKFLEKASKSRSGAVIKASSKALGAVASKVAARLGIQLGAKTSALAAKVGTKLAAAGPVGAAMIVFDILSIALDLSDVGSYNKMGNKKMYLEMKKEIDTELAKAYTEEGSTFPIVISPMSKLTEEEFTNEISKKIVVLMDMSDPDKVDPLVKPMIDALKNDIISGKITEADLEVESNIDAYVALIDMNAMITKAMGLICIDKDGKVVNGECTYKDKESCDKSYGWPLNPDKDMYAEYDNTTGTCKTANAAIRTICETAKLPYNSDTGICDITENYCKTKGADWVDGDCVIKPGQEFFEFFLGTTVTRGLKQVFDPFQYESCQSGEIDDGYFCRKPDTCTDKQVNILGLCYDKCGEDGHACYKGCPPNFRDDGAYCAKPAPLPVERRSPTTIPCGPGETDESGSCWVKTTGRPVGTIPKLNDCKDGSYDVLGTCWMHNYKTSWGSVGCTGGRPWRPEGYSDCYTSDFPYVYTNIGDRGTNCPPGQVNEAGLCYDQCPEGFWGRGLDCVPNNAIGSYITKLPTDRYQCSEDEDLQGIFCYKRCPTGYHKFGLDLCSPDCPEGYVDIGVSCHKLTPAVKIRPKKRIVEYSNKNN